MDTLGLAVSAGPRFSYWPRGASELSAKYFLGIRTLDDSPHLVQRAALADRVPGADFLQFRHHVHEHFVEILRHSTDAWVLDAFQNRAHGLHHPDQLGAILHRAGEGSFGVDQ